MGKKASNPPPPVEAVRPKPSPTPPGSLTAQDIKNDLLVIENGKLKNRVRLLQRRIRNLKKKTK